jgi:hypothetical protein
MQRQHLKRPILDLAAGILWQSHRCNPEKRFLILVPALALIVFLLLVLSEKAEE